MVGASNLGSWNPHWLVFPNHVPNPEANGQQKIPAFRLPPNRWVGQDAANPQGDVGSLMMQKKRLQYVTRIHYL